jgi:hypothetical protein
MGRTGSSKNVRGIATASEISRKELDTPSIVGLANTGRGVTYFNRVNTSDITKPQYALSNVYYPVYGDIANESIEIAQFYDKNNNLKLLNIEVDDNGKSKFYQTYSFTQGSPNSIEIPYNPPYLKDTVMVHNHPGGTAISLNDFKVAKEISLKGVEARLNPNSYWDSIRQLQQNKADVRYQLNNLKNELKQNKPAVNIINSVNSVLDKYVNYDETRPIMVAQIKKAKTKWPNLNERKLQDLQIATEHMYYQLFENTNLSRNTAQFLMSHAFMNELANQNGFSYGVYQA